MSAVDQTQYNNNGIDDLDQLTPEERAAIEDGAADDAEMATLSRLAQSDDDGDDIDPESPDAVTDAPPAAAATPAADPPPQAQAAPAYEYTLPDDFQARKDALAAKAEVLNSQFEAGEIESSDLTAGLRALAAQEGELGRMEVKAEVSREMHEQREAAAQNENKAAWESAVSRAIESAAKPENGGVDYKNDAEKMADLDMLVRRLGADPKNSDKNMDWFLIEGHKRVLALHGLTSTAKPGGAAAPTSRAPPKSPVSLAHVPGSDGPGDVSDEFVDLDALDGDALEDALAQMQRSSPARYEKYQRVGR